MPTPVRETLDREAALALRQATSNGHVMHPMAKLDSIGRTACRVCGARIIVRVFATRTEIEGDAITRRCQGA